MRLFSGRWCYYAFTVTVSYVITREWWFRVYFLHAENLSLSTKSNLMHIAPRSEDDLRQLSNLLWYFVRYAIKPLLVRSILTAYPRVLALCNEQAKSGNLLYQKTFLPTVSFTQGKVIMVFIYATSRGKKIYVSLPTFPHTITLST